MNNKCKIIKITNFTLFVHVIFFTVYILSLLIHYINKFFNLFSRYTLVLVFSRTTYRPVHIRIRIKMCRLNHSTRRQLQRERNRD